MKANYPSITLKSGREKSFKNRHPWVFSGAVNKLPKGNHPVVQVLSSKEEHLGYGFYDPNSQIVCRLFEFGEMPADVLSDVSYWKGKIQRAMAMRTTLGTPTHSNAYRLLHAEGDFFPGIIADVYNTTVVLHLMVDALVPLADTLRSILLDMGFKTVFIKQNPAKNMDEAIWLGEAPTQPVEIVEHGIKFWADLANGQKTGLFLDQRYSRARVGHFAAGKRVLNTFGYQGGFSLYALKNNAQSVTTVDISAPALAWCEKNIALNFADCTDRHTAVEADCFQYLRDMPADFDLIILDPPAFAKSVASVDKAARGYKDINYQTFKKCMPGTLLFTFSCSQKISPDLFQKIVFSAAADAGKQVRIVEKLCQGEDHPINIFHPEGEYLKGLLLYVE